MEENNKQAYEPNQSQPAKQQQNYAQQPVAQQNYVQQPVAQQNYVQRPVAQQPVYVQQQPAYDPTKEVMSVGSYIGTFILSSIPVVNIICWIVWLISSKTNKNKKNYLIACIVLWIIGVLVSIIACLIASALGYDVTKYLK
ncbi:MAG: hypothetical protein IKE65_05215 [Clostridia bacterium]|nr:hypothetical protein [Clostridia bacterium]